MTLKTQMTSDLSIFLNTDEFAETITYTPSGGSATSISAIVEKDDIFQEPYVRGPDTATCLVYVKASDVSTPQFGDTFTIDSVVWEFDPSRGVIYMDDDVYVIGLERQMS